MARPERYWVFALFDAAGVCLYVGKTSRQPIKIIRTYANTRDWGKRVDRSRTLVIERSITEKQADIKVRSWVRHKRPLYRSEPVPKQSEFAVMPDTMVSRAVAAQRRHQELSKPVGSRSKQAPVSSGPPGLLERAAAQQAASRSAREQAG
jgi:hypothetical protein